MEGIIIYKKRKAREKMFLTSAFYSVLFWNINSDKKRQVIFQTDANLSSSNKK